MDQLFLPMLQLVERPIVDPLAKQRLLHQLLELMCRQMVVFAMQRPIHPIYLHHARRLKMLWRQPSLLVLVSCLYQLLVQLF
jgi:hypothetical protein